MKKTKFISLLLTLVMFLLNISSYASVYLEDFTSWNRYFTLSSSIVPAYVSDGKFIFDYSDVSQASEEDVSAKRYMYHKYITAKNRLYVEFDFEVTDTKNTKVQFELRNYDDGYTPGIGGTLLPFTLQSEQITFSDGSKMPCMQNKGMVTVDAVVDENDTIDVKTYLDGELIHHGTRKNFSLCPKSSFEYRIVTGATVKAGERGPKITIDNIKTVIDESIPEVYVGDATTYFDFGDNRFFPEKNAFPYYKARSTRQIANFTRDEKTLTNILALYSQEPSFTTENITLNPGEVKYLTLEDETGNLKNGGVSSYVWDSLKTITPLSKSHDILPSLVRSETPEDIENRLDAAENVHPRLLISDEEIEKHKQYQKENSTFDYMQNALLSWDKTHDGSGFLTCSTPKYGQNSGNAPDIIYNRALVWGYLYRAYGNEEYAKMLMEDMLTFSSYPDWYHGDSFLKTAHITEGMAIGYDFIYDYLSKEENIEKHKIITDAIYEKGIKKALDVFREDSPSGWHKRITNWNMICNSGIGVACLAIGDLDEYKTDCAISLSYILRNLRYAVEYYPAEGGCVEGPGYLNYMMSHGVNFFASLVNSFGDDFGYFGYSCLKNTASDPIKLSGSNYSFTYASAYPTVTNRQPFLGFFGKFLQMQELGHFRLKQVGNAIEKIVSANEDMSAISGNYSVLDIIWYDPSFTQVPENAKKSGYDEIYGIKKDAFYKGAGMVAFHSDYSENQGFVAADFGKNKETGSHIDMGNFVYETDGEQWFVELGLVPYDQKNSASKDYYRAKPEGHNCVVINPDSSYGQPHDAEGYAEDVYFGDECSYAVMNISSAYEDNAQYFKRLIYFDKNTKGLAIKDKFLLKENDSEYYWFAHTGAKITISDDGKSAILEKENGKKLKVLLLSEGEFSAMDAVRLSPKTEDIDDDPENKGIKKLTVHQTEKSGECEITVVMVPLLSDDTPVFPDISKITF
ncbi:MAG: heparinase II/III family protein [Clostridia bacterium]|nr:heparinase II/III family protein [Clostridia bacterium]